MSDPITVTPEPERSKKLPWGLLLLVFGAIDLLVPALLLHMPPDLLSTILPGSIFFGTLAGQVGVLAVWAVFGTWPLLRRWILALLGVVVIGTIELFAILIAEPSARRHLGEALEPFVVFLAMVPLRSPAAQVPLWILKAIIGSRVTRDAAGNFVATRPTRQFGLQHLFWRAQRQWLSRWGWQCEASTVGADPHARSNDA